MTTLTTIQNQLPAIDTQQAAAVAEAFDNGAAAVTFAIYRQNLASSTIRTHAAAIASFEQFRNDNGVQVENMTDNVTAWHGVTHGVIEAFKLAQYQSGAALATINQRLSIIRTYAGLAFKAGVIAGDDWLKIQTVKGYKLAADKKRPFTRRGAKKAEFYALTSKQIKAIESSFDLNTAQGLRDAMLFDLLVFHGLRASEVAQLTIANIDTGKQLLTFKRPKLAKFADKPNSRYIARHEINDINRLKLAKRYLRVRGGAAGDPFIVGSMKGGALTDKGMKTRAITKRVRRWGKIAGIDNLSAHDLRHTAASIMASRYSVNEIMDWFGWSTPAMALKYIEAQTTQKRDKG